MQKAVSGNPILIISHLISFVFHMEKVYTYTGLPAAPLWFAELAIRVYEKVISCLDVLEV